MIQGIPARSPGLSWAIDLCDVLDYLHKHKPDPIIFRDMKPSNVMINNNGDVMLVDFGIAKTFQTGIKGTMIGTEGYSPPEQYRGEATPAADIYALGATIHHALIPPRSAPGAALLLCRTSAAPDQLSSVSAEMEAVVNTALEYSPESRFRSCGGYEAGAHACRPQDGRACRMRLPPADRFRQHRRDQAVVVL